MKGLLTIAWDTFSLWETLFPTSTASFSVTKSTVLSQTTNVCSAMNAIRESKSSHNTSRWSLVARVTRVYFSRETKEMKIHGKLVTLISKTFHHFSRSTADNKRRTRSDSRIAADIETMKLSQIEKRIPQTLTNSKDIIQKDREHARRSSRARSTRGQENEAWALYKKYPSWEAWGDLSGDRNIICPKPPSPAGKILDRMQLFFLAVPPSLL